MAKVTEKCFETTGRTCFICDFSPPRSGDISVLQNTATEAVKGADFISIAYNPAPPAKIQNPYVPAGAIRACYGLLSS